MPHALDDAERARVASLYALAGQETLRAQLGRDTESLRVLAVSARADRLVLARHGGEIVGLAGLWYDGDGAFSWSMDDVVRARGRVRARLLDGALRAVDPVVPGDELYVDGLAVDLDHRGQGVATHLLEAVCTRAARLGKHAVILSVTAANPRPQTLYERLGFVPYATRRHRIAGRVLGSGGWSTLLRRRVP